MSEYPYVTTHNINGSQKAYCLSSQCLGDNNDR